jgi:hypothetical protein
MKRTVPPLTAGYSLRVAPVIDDKEGKRKTRFTLETSQLFASFVYDLSVQERRDDNHIHFKILGLRPPQLTMPAAGRATFERDYDDLSGMCHVTVETIDGKTNTFKLRIGKDRISLLQSPPKKFVDLVLS